MRKRRLFVPVLFLGIALIATACGGGKTPADPDKSTQNQEAPTPDKVATEGETVTVDIVDFIYEPQELTVAPGTTVTWTNKDAVAHTVTADDDSFDSGTMNEGDTWSYTFDEPGEYPYYCIPHPFMTATVIVKE